MAQRTMATRWLFRVLLTAACTAVSSAAQNDVEAGRRSGVTAPPAVGSTAPQTTVSKSHAPAVAEHGFRNDVEADAVLGRNSPKPVADKPDSGIPVAIAAHGQCSFAVSVTPAKLMAGQTGTVSIVMILQADSVMESASSLRIDCNAEVAAKSLLRLGAATVLPPRSANLATAYRGRQVYDNCAIIQLPITMSAEAPLQSVQAIDVEARFRLHEGSTGRLFGEYCNPLTITVEVGEVPDPAIRRSPSATGTTGPVLTAEVAPAEQAQLRDERPPTAHPQREAAGGSSPTGDPDPTARSSQQLPESSGGAELSWFLVGSALLVAVVVLVSVRRR